MVGVWGIIIIEGNATRRHTCYINLLACTSYAVSSMFCSCTLVLTMMDTFQGLIFILFFIMQYKYNNIVSWYLDTLRQDKLHQINCEANKAATMNHTQIVINV